MTDYIQSKYIEKFQDSEIDKQSREHETNDSGEEIDSDAIFEELENELESADSQAFQKHREARMEEMSKQLDKSKRAIQEHLQSNESPLKEIDDEGELMKLTANNSLVVTFFYNDTFKTCQLMEEALEKMAYRHVSTRFYKIKAYKAPFLAVKLGIKVLPCVVMYTNGLERARIVGFEGLLQGTPVAKGAPLDPFKHFNVENLERVLLLNGMIERKAFDLKNIRQKKSYKDDEGEDYESDLDI